MTNLQPVLFPVLIDAATDPLVRAVAAYLARYRGQTRVHTESDLRAYLVWCRERGVEPLKANRAQIELYCDGCRKSAASSPPQ
jgi:integrase/recombinase XerD